MENFFENMQNMNPGILEYVINSLILNDNITDENNNENENEVDEFSTTTQTTPFSYGCKHYLRRCKIVSPCCNEIYSCRLCHNNS